MPAWEVVSADSRVLARFEDSPIAKLWAEAFARTRGARVEFSADDVELFPGTLLELGSLSIRRAG